MNRAFWRKNKTLAWNEQILLNKCLEAHREATFRQNLSSAVITEAYKANGNDFLKAVASGLGTVGGLHAPIVETHEFLEYHKTVRWHWQSFARDGMKQGERLPGWGSAFVKGKPDSIVEHAMLYIDTGWPDMGKRIERITQFLHGEGKHVYPNMACLTAATALILQIPKELAPVLFLQGRALAWAEIVHDSTRQAPAEQVRNN